MHKVHYYLVPQGLMMAVNGDPTYWFDHKVSFGILWERLLSGEIEIIRHGRVESVLERQQSQRAFYCEIGAAPPKSGRRFVMVQDLDTSTIEILNRVLAGEEKPKALIAAMERLSSCTPRRKSSLP